MKTNFKFDRKSDKVAIIAPSSAYVDENGNFDIVTSKARLEFAVSLFEQHGFICKYDDKIFVQNDIPYFAAPKEERLRQLRDAIEDPEVKIISALRGGYGAGEIVFDCLDVKPSGDKILIGYSDITVLHFLFNQHYRFPSIHGMVNESHKHMRGDIISVLSGKPVHFALKSLNELSKSESNISGYVTGGNLTLICNMIGTKLHPDTKDKILVIEDVNEKGYQVHRHLLHMYNTGLFDKAKAVILGDFTKSDNLLDASLDNFVNNYLQSVPVFKATGIGHGEMSRPLAIGGLGHIGDLDFCVESLFELV